MANKTATRQPVTLKTGNTLTAEQINRIVDMLIVRISGGKGVNVRAFGKGIIIEDSSV